MTSTSLFSERSERVMRQVEAIVNFRFVLVVAWANVKPDVILIAFPVPYIQHKLQQRQS